jgi:hypothetical protein
MATTKDNGKKEVKKRGENRDSPLKKINKKLRTKP